MNTLFHSGTFSNRSSESFAPSSASAVRTEPVTAFKQNKEKSPGKEMNNRADRRNIRFSPGLLLDYTLFSYILAIDAGLTAKELVRNRLRTKKSIPA